MHDDEEERCGQCGLPRSVCSDPDTPYYPQRSYCWSTAARDMTLRRWEAVTKNVAPDPAGYLPTDGATIWVSPEDHSPTDDFLRRPDMRGLMSEGGDHGGA